MAVGTRNEIAEDRMLPKACRKRDQFGLRFFVGGSDARIIIGNDEAALVRLWREKRGEADPEDLSGNLIVQLGAATEELNRVWYERNTGRNVRDVQRLVKHSAVPWMAATLDGIVEGTEAVFEAKFMLPWSFSEEAAAEKYMAQVQHNMWVTHLRTSVLSIITGGGKWVEITIPMDPLYLTVLVSAEKNSGVASNPAKLPTSLRLSRRDLVSRRSVSST
jgi:predicted phage-related endonuclease